MRTFEGPLDGSELRIAIVIARFNQLVTERLLEGAVQTALEHGVEEDRLATAWRPPRAEPRGWT